MQNIHEYEQHLKEICNFISVKCKPRSDGYGTDITVELTDSQMNYFNTFSQVEIEGKLLASHIKASHVLQGRNMCKEPYLSLRGNNLIFWGSIVAAYVFLMDLFHQD